MMLLKKYRSVIAYFFWGIVTTILNIGIFLIIEKVGIYYQIGNILGWFVAVTVSYFTNKVWVFNSDYRGLKHTMFELGNFFFYRIVTLIMDIVITYVGITILEGNSFIVKVLDNIAVVICNYIFSKILVFKKSR